MKLLAISDIHGLFYRFKPESLPAADVALIGGDFTNEGIYRPHEVDEAEQWMTRMAARYPHVLYVMGNHDLQMPDSFFEREGQSIRNIAGKVVEIEGHRFVGADLSPCFDLPGLADEWDHMTADETVDAAYFDALPAGDIIVSHCPPLGFLDEFRRSGSGRHLGSPGLRRYIERFAPQLLVCGHIHEGSGEAMIGPTRAINVALRYQLVEVQ